MEGVGRGWRNESKGMEGWSLVPQRPHSLPGLYSEGQTQPLTS